MDGIAVASTALAMRALRRAVKTEVEAKAYYLNLQTVHDISGSCVTPNKCSAVAEIGERLATIDMG